MGIGIEIARQAGADGEAFEDGQLGGVERPEVAAHAEQFGAAEVAGHALKAELAEIEIQLHPDFAVIVRGFVGIIVHDKAMAEPGGIERAGAGVDRIHFAAIAQIAQHAKIVVAGVPVFGANAAGIDIIEQVDIQTDAKLAEGQFGAETERDVIFGLGPFIDTGKPDAADQPSPLFPGKTQAAIIILGPGRSADSQRKQHDPEILARHTFAPFLTCAWKMVLFKVYHRSSMPGGVSKWVAH